LCISCRSSLFTILHDMQRSRCCTFCSFCHQAPTYTTKDFIVAIRDGKTEVWSTRAFAPGEIWMCPLGNEVKDNSCIAVAQCLSVCRTEWLHTSRQMLHSCCKCSSIWPFVLCDRFDLVASIIRQPRFYFVVSVRFFLEDAYWTTGRSVLLGGSSNRHPDKKHMAIDGRVRCTPGPDRSFALFWALERSQVSVMCN